MNVAVVFGNLGRDPEIRELKNGSTVANFSLAVNEKRGDDVHTEWYNVVAWGENAKTAEQFAKGDRVVVVGVFRTRKWADKDGNERYSTELNCSDWNGAVALAPAPEKRGESRSRRGSDDSDRGSSRRSSSSRGGDRDSVKKKYEVDDDIPW